MQGVSHQEERLLPLGRVGWPEGWIGDRLVSVVFGSVAIGVVSADIRLQVISDGGWGGAAVRVTAIEGRELFSFDVLRLGDLSRTVVVVGPNGAGKTNLLRLVDVVRAAVERSATYSQESYQLLRRFAAARRFGAAPGNLSGVRLSIVLTEPWERELLGSFVRAAVATALLQGTGGNADTASVLARIRHQLDEAELQPLNEGAIIAELTDGVAGMWSVIYEFDVTGQRFHWVIDGVSGRGRLVGITDAARSDLPAYPVTRKLDPDEHQVPRQPLTLGALLPQPGEATVLTLDPGQQPAELTREFARLAGMPLADADRTAYSLAHVLRVVLDRALVLLGDSRQPPLASYSAEDLSHDPAPVDGSRIPVRLFRLKNGSAAGRLQYARIQDLFTRLTGLTFDISMSDLSREDTGVSVIQISVMVQQNGHDLPIEFAGAGLWEALLLSATLPESAGLVAMLDEPARNLHPTLQRTLLAEINGAPGQFILTTHSPYLVPLNPAGALPGIVRLAANHGATRACRFSPGNGLLGTQLGKVLCESADARALLFARGVILVEGDTELGALPEWFAKSATAAHAGAPDALNVAIYSVDGDAGFQIFVALLHSLGIPWTIVCDGFVYRFGQRTKQIFEQVLDAGAGTASIRNVVDQARAGDTPSFAELRSIGEACGIFTLAQGSNASDESFETYIETISPGSLAASASVVGRSKPRQGRYVAAATDCPSEVDSLYAKLLNHLAITRR